MTPTEAQRSSLYSALIVGLVTREPSSHAEPDRREMAERSLGFASPILNEESDRDRG